MSIASELGSALTRWHMHPAAMAEELFGMTPDAWQAEAFEAFPHNPYLSLQAPICVKSEVWTPTGLRRWGDLGGGDSVFAEDGTATSIMRRFDVGRVPLYRVRFSDGTSLRVSADHEWKVQGQYDRKIGQSRTVSTRWLLDHPLKSKGYPRKQNLYSIPAQGAVMTAIAILPLDPYVFGLWLGDGVRGEPTIVCPDESIRSEIEARGFPLKLRRSTNAIQYKLKTKRGSFTATGSFHQLSYQKTIPALYKLASPAQRLDLLRGLMDSDGTVAKNGQTYLATSSRTLVDDFAWLARSLGYLAIPCGPYAINGGKNRDSYRVTISGPECPFLADTMKRRRWHKPDLWRYTRYISSVERDGEGEAMCIEVAHSSHCFQATDFIVTHNCKGPGKTAVEAILGWNFLLTRPHPKIAATSISGDNLRDNLWTEMAAWRNKAPLLQQLFEWTTTRIFSRQHPETWWASARTWPKTGDANAQANTLAGLHADYIMFLVDESGGVPDAVMVSAEAAMSSCKEGHIVQAGNCTHLEGPLWRASRDRVRDGGRWYVIEITGDPDDPNRSPRVSVEWARQQIREYGINNPWVLVNVFGRFPPSSINALIGEDELRVAMGRYYRAHEIGSSAKIIGVDVARQGDDASVLFKRQGIQSFGLRRMRNYDSNQGASVVLNEWNEFGADACFIDATGGYGWGWVDQLRNLGKSPIPIQFSNEATDKERYYNKRAEMYFNAVKWIREGGALPNEEIEGARELMLGLARTTYTFKGDRLILEDKELVKAKMNGMSPDETDAFVVTFAEPVTASQRRTIANHNAVRQPYDPFRDLDRAGGGAYAGGSYNPFASE